MSDDDGSDGDLAHHPDRILLTVGPTPGSSPDDDGSEEPSSCKGVHSNVSFASGTSGGGGRGRRQPSMARRAPSRTSSRGSSTAAPESPRGLTTVASAASSGFSAIRADLAVDLEHRVYYPGAVLKGTVRLSVRKPTKFYALRLRISGKESMVIRKKKNGSEILTRQRETFWKQLTTLEGTSKTRSTQNSENERQRSMFTSAASQVRLAANQVHMCPPGEYVYPFEVQIPYTAPPSFEEFGEDEDYAAIVYYAKAYLDIPGGGDSDLIGRTFFRVVSRVGTKQWKAAAKPVADRRTHAITGCCGMSKGLVKTSVEVPRCLVSIADDSFIPFRVVVNNTDGHEPVNRVNVELEHVMDVYANGETEERRTVIASQTEVRQIPAGKTDGIIGKMMLPEDCPPSMRGILFSSTFALRIECDVPYAVDPVTVIPITIVHRAESKEPVPIVIYDEAGYRKMSGMCEFHYECPESRENDLQRMVLGAGGGGGGSPFAMMPSAAFGTMQQSVRGGVAPSLGAFDDDDDHSGDLLTPPPIDYSRVAKRRPDQRWKFVPPVDYS